MGQCCYIEVKCGTPHGVDGIAVIFKNGHRKGLRFMDLLWRESGKDFQEITPDQATRITKNAMAIKDFPGIFTILDSTMDASQQGEGQAHATIFLCDNPQDLTFFVSDFGGGIRKDGVFVDFNFYVHLFLSLCDEFLIFKIQAGCRGNKNHSLVG